MVRQLSIRRLRTRSIRATIVSLLLCAFAVGLTGFPVFQVTGKTSAGKDRSQPFPCMDKPCGCSDAATCWKQCCCHTNTEKLAWAKKHGVTPPQFVVDAARRETPKVAACCQPKAAASCCSAATPTCCQTPSPEPEVAVEQPNTPQPWKLVVLEDERKCRGLAPLWLMLGQALECRIEPIVVTAPSAGAWIGVLSERAERGHTPPALPPPRKVVG